jgi:hypothetical protein
MERSTSMARHSRLYSSITLGSFNWRPSPVWSNWKSSADTTLGRIGHMAPTATPIPRSGFLCLR